MNIILAVLISALFAVLIGSIFQLVAQQFGINKTTSKILSILVVCIVVLMGSNYLVKNNVNAVNQDNQRILVGTSADFPPFSFIENDQIVGFDIDLINEIGRRLQQEIEIKNMPFGTLLPTLQLGQIQVIAAGLSATVERAKHVLFTTPYLDNNPFVIVSLAANPVKDISDLYNQEVIVNEGYTADIYLSNIDKFNLKRLKTPAEAFLALKSGRAKAFVTAQDTVAPFFAQYDANDFNLVEIPNTSENTSLAFAPQYPQLRQKIQAVLDEMQNDGTLSEIKQRWKLT